MPISSTNPHRVALFRQNLMGGGAEKVIVTLARHFAKDGFEVDLVLSRAEGPLLETVPPQVRIVDLKAAQIAQKRALKLPTSFQSTSSLPKLVRYLQKERPTALLSASHYSNEVAILAKQLAGIPTRVVVSEHIALSIQAKGVEQVSSRFAPLAARLLYSRADGIVAVSQGVAKDLAQVAHLNTNRIQVIYNPVITSELAEKAKQPVEHPWFAPDNPPVVLGVGRLVKQKDFSNLIRAFAQVRQFREARLVILGSGREQNRLKALVKELNLEDEVALLGFVKNPYAYMARAGVFVLSSGWEGLPTVLIEAMAVGTPVVSTNCPSGPEEILNNGQYGELVPIANSRALAEAIVQVLSGKTKSVDVAWLEQFTLETALQKYQQVLNLSLSECVN
ncbi:MAG: glycosyltransferase [Cyanophyceae cyanobacterium]